MSPTACVAVLAVDVMGGDQGPRICVPAAVRLYRDYRDTKLILYGEKAEILQHLSAQGAQLDARLEVVATSVSVQMDDPPLEVLRSKRASSMGLSVESVRDGNANACVSAGNTGALMAASRYFLRTVPGVVRPAIAASLPTSKGFCLCLDLGANVDCRSEHLFQFAVMGTVLMQSISGSTAPKVALLNVGQEANKGNDRIKQADRLLKNSSLNYAGFIEGDAIFNGDMDVIVTDGFTGNIALKTMEGTCNFILERSRRTLSKGLLRSVAFSVLKPLLNSVKTQIDPRSFNGASILGLSGVVIKSHGNADEFSFFKALELARKEAVFCVPSKLGKQIDILL